MKAHGVLVLGLLGLAGCGGSGPERPLPDVSGTWSYRQVVSGGATTCGDGGQVVISQAGQRVSGTLSGRGGCQSESLAIDYIRRETLVSASLLRTTLRFSAGSCAYQGTVVGDPATQASGTVTCSNLASTRLSLVGTWELRR